MALAKLVKGRSHFLQARAFHQAALSKPGRDLHSVPEQFLLEHADDLTPSMVVDFIQKQNNPELAYRFFSLAGLHAGYKHDAVAYSTILHCLCKSNQFAHIPTVLGDMIAQNCCVRNSTLTYVLKSMGDAGLAQETLTLFEKLISGGVEPSHRTYNSVVSTLVKAGETKKAMQLLAQMVDEGVYIDSMLVGMFTNALCKAGKVIEAVKLVESVVVKMPGSVDALTVHGLVGHLCQAERLSDALKFVKNMKAFAVCPDVVTYNKLMDGFCRKGRVDEALRLLDKMSEESITPTPATLSTLLDGLCKQGRIDEALLLFEKMGSTVEEGPIQYNILVHALCNRKRIKDAWDLTSEMVRKGVALTVHTYTAIVCGFLGLDKEKEAVKVLHEMREMGVKGDSRFYNSFVTWFCKKGKVDNALELLVEMIEGGGFPDQHTLSAVIAGLCKVNRVVEALEFGYEMMKSGCAWNVVVFNPILQVLCELGDKEEAFKLLDVVSDKGAVPSRSTFNGMLKGLCMSKRFDDVRKLLAEMKRSGFDPDLTTYATLINANAHHASGTVDLFTPLIGSNIVFPRAQFASLLDGLCQTGEVEFALKLLKDMQGAGCKMSSTLFNVLINGLCKSNRLQEARDYFLKMRDCGCNPDLITFTTLMHGFRSASQFDVLDLLYKEMQANGCKPDAVTYSVLLVGFAQGELFKELYGILDDMKAQSCPPNLTTLKLLFQHLRYKDAKRVSKYIKEGFGIAFDEELSETAQPVKTEEEDITRRFASRLGVTRREEREAQHFEKPVIHSVKGSSDDLEGQAPRVDEDKKSRAKSTAMSPVVQGKKKSKEDAFSCHPSCVTSASKALKEGNLRQTREQGIGKHSQKSEIVSRSCNRSEASEKAYQDKKELKFVKEGLGKSPQTSKTGEKQKQKHRKFTKEQ